MLIVVVVTLQSLLVPRYFFGFKGFEFVQIFMNPLDSIIFKIISFYSFSFNLGTSTSLGMARRMDKLDH